MSKLITNYKSVLSESILRATELAVLQDAARRFQPLGAKIIDIFDLFNIDCTVDLSRGELHIKVLGVPSCRDLTIPMGLLELEGIEFSSSKDWAEYRNRDYDGRHKDGISVKLEAYFGGDCTKVVIGQSPEYAMVCGGNDEPAV